MSGVPDTSADDRLRPGLMSNAGESAVEATRSEEELKVGSEVRVTGRAVLRRYLITETVTQTFQVRHEEFRLDYEPVSTASPPPVDGAAFSDRVVEMVLHREVPVVQMRVEATEVVRLHIDTVTEQVQVSDQVRKERLDIDVPAT